MYMRAYCMNYSICKQYTNITDYKNNVNPQYTHARMVCVQCGPQKLNNKGMHTEATPTLLEISMY